ncbi:hypothetical protein MELB17_08411 [Marinobacter sp. ELB17]|nr:hypothetical protein MELB17_08411 [Marinobacter sp. ELB17]
MFPSWAFFYGGQDFEVALQFELDDQPFRTLFPGDRLKVCPRFTSASAFGTDFKSVPAVRFTPWGQILNLSLLFFY